MCKLYEKYIIILEKCKILITLNYIECNQNILKNYSQLNQQVCLFLNYNYKVTCISRAILIISKEVNYYFILI